MDSKLKVREIVSIIDIRSKKLIKVLIHMSIIIQKVNVIIKVKILVKLVSKKTMNNHCSCS
jgi:hypothetical protein